MILKLIKTQISPLLANLFNQSFSTGIFPDTRSKLLCNNYRPISLLSNISKLLEKLMYSTAFLRNLIVYIPCNLVFATKRQQIILFSASLHRSKKASTMDNFLVVFSLTCRRLSIQLIIIFF